MNKEKYLKRQKIDIERGEYERERRKKYLNLKRLGQYLVSKRSEKPKEVQQSIPSITEQDKLSMYSYPKTLKKGIKYAVLFALGAIINEVIVHYPVYMDLTIGFVLVQIYDYLKHNLGVRIP